MEGESKKRLTNSSWSRKGRIRHKKAGKTKAGIRMGAFLLKGRVSHSRGVKEKMPTPLERELAYSEQNEQDSSDRRVRALNVGKHNVLAPRTRSNPLARSAVSGRRSSRSWAEITVVITQTPSNKTKTKN